MGSTILLISPAANCSGVRKTLGENPVSFDHDHLHTEYGLNVTTLTLFIDKDFTKPLHPFMKTTYFIPSYSLLVVSGAGDD
jgi:hypothetical protein